MKELQKQILSSTLKGEELIKVFKKDNKEMASGRELHEYLGVGRRFTTWIQGRIAEYGFEENVDFVVNRSFSQNGEKGGRPLEDYLITLDMAKELCMLEKNELGRKARKYFIERDKKLTAIENDIRRQINNGAIHGAQGKEFAKYPHAYVDELLNKAYVLGGKEAYQLANIIYECGEEMASRRK
nr:MAG TPA: AntA/AntB antirepressor [Caudoviricetes sp.]